jgi:ElaB/YqjD/DUF883 family membrane-anchored ribosome-binding protein
VAADPVLSLELKSLQEEVAAAQREREASARPAPAAAAVAAAALEETADEKALRDQLGEFVDQVTQFFEDAEKNIAAHPAESVIGALLLGILIGRLLGRG